MNMQTLTALVLAILLSDAGARQEPPRDLPADVFVPASQTWGLIDPLPADPILDWIMDQDGRFLLWPDRKPVILIASR
jgi:hypothetical protein